MGKRIQSLAAAIALASAALFVGPSTSSAEARQVRHYRYGPHAGAYYAHGYARPYRYGYGYGRAFAPYPYYPGYRTVRVFVYDPFPRWVYRRVYYAPPAAAPYCAPY
jgi:hypothetical protein